MQANFNQQVHALTQQIPTGKVATYGLIARWLGKPRAARAVGWALRQTPTQMNLPAHRVVRKDGTLANDEVFGGKSIQYNMLRDEGVPFKNEQTIDMKKAVWEGPADAFFEDV